MPSSLPNDFVVEQRDPARTLHFALLENGHITCQTAPCSTAINVWCEHSDYIMRRHEDSHAIWDKDPDAMHIDQFNLQVPMFPSKNMWTSVLLVIDRDRLTPVFKVYWDDRSQNTRFICNLNPGEGRLVIREMLWEYMLIDSSRTKECDDAAHSMGAQVEWIKDFREGGITSYAQAWSVYTTGQCLHCATFDPDASDLVPETEKSGVWK